MAAALDSDPRHVSTSFSLLLFLFHSYLDLTASSDEDGEWWASEDAEPAEVELKWRRSSAGKRFATGAPGWISGDDGHRKRVESGGLGGGAGGADAVAPPVPVPKDFDVKKVIDENEKALLEKPVSVAFVGSENEGGRFWPLGALGMDLFSLVCFFCGTQPPNRQKSLEALHSFPLASDGLGGSTHSLLGDSNHRYGGGGGGGGGGGMGNPDAITASM